jgi:hypothetical protein
MISSVTTFFLYAGILAIPLAEAFPKLTPAFNLAVCCRSACHTTFTHAHPCVCACVRFSVAAR